MRTTRFSEVLTLASCLIIPLLLLASCGDDEQPAPGGGNSANNEGNQGNNQDNNQDNNGSTANNSNSNSNTVGENNPVNNLNNANPGELSNADVYERLRPSCLPCHGENTAEPWFGSLQEFEVLLVADRRYITPGDPDNSAMILMLEGQGEGIFAQMPLGDFAFYELEQMGLTDITVDELKAWIAAMEGDGEPPIDCDLVWPGPAPVRRLTSTEYNNVVQDLLGIPIRPADGFPPEEETLGFDNNAQALNVTQLLAEKYFEAAEASADSAIDNVLVLIESLNLSCRATTDPCIREFAEKLATRAYRRPLEPEELERILALYAHGRDEFGGPIEGIKLVIAGVLQSPHFLYRIEFGQPAPAGAATTPLTGHEMASRLSFFLWNSMPDAALFDAADAGTLSTPAEIEAHARRMIDHPRARRAIMNFYRQWLKIKDLDIVQKSARSFPDWTPELAELLDMETQLFIESIIWEGGGNFKDSLTSPHTFVNGELAGFYGYDRIPGDAFVRVEFDAEERAGLLTQGSVMATLAKDNQTSPILRGVFVREQILCQPLPQPPDNVDNSPPELAPDATTRERFAAHTAIESCAACHDLIDPIGFAFEHYDAVGRYREQENGLPIDTTGFLTATEDVDGEFHGAVEMAQMLAESEQVQDCFVTQWFRYGHGRVETAQDVCTLETLQADFADNDFDIKELLIAMTRTDAFLHRPVVQ